MLVEITYGFGEGAITGTIRSLGERNCHVDTSTRLADGTAVRITPLLTGSASIVELKGEVSSAYEDERGAGLCIDFVAPLTDLMRLMRREFESGTS